MDGSSYNVVDRKSLHLVGMLLASQNEKQCSFAIRSDIQDDVHPDVPTVEKNFSGAPK